MRVDFGKECFGKATRSPLRVAGPFLAIRRVLDFAAGFLGIFDRFEVVF